MKLSSSFSLAIKHAAALERLLQSGRFVEDIDAAQLKKLGAEAVILDHDGVLGPSFSFTPDQAGLEFLNALAEAFGQSRLFVLSNTRSRRNSREKAYRENLPGITYIKARRKPDPEGLLIASRVSGLPKKKIAVVDDGILTGILMAVENGAIPVYVTRKRLDESLAAKCFRLGTTWSQIALTHTAWLISRISRRRGDQSL